MCNLYFQIFFIIFFLVLSQLISINKSAMIWLYKWNYHKFTVATPCQLWIIVTLNCKYFTLPHPHIALTLFNPWFGHRLCDHSTGWRESLCQSRKEESNRPGGRQTGCCHADGTIVHHSTTQRGSLRIYMRYQLNYNRTVEVAHKLTQLLINLSWLVTVDLISSLQILMEVARSKNSVPLPPAKPHCGIRLPPDRYCLSACNYKLKVLKQITLFSLLL